MKRIITILLAILVAGGSSQLWAAKVVVKSATKAESKTRTPGTVAPAVELKGGESADQIQKAYVDGLTALVPALGTNDNNNATLNILEATVHQAGRAGAEPERLACCQAILGLLQSETTTDIKVCLMRQLLNIGKTEVVAAETKFLDDKEPLLREVARASLQNNPTPEAAEALRSALGKATEPAWQAALANALAGRKDAASVPAIAKLLSDKDEATVKVALDALARIGGADAVKAVSDAVKSLPEKLRIAAGSAALKCANGLLQDGKNAEAAAIFKELYQPSLPLPVRHGALRGLLAGAGDQAVPKMLELLAGSDADACSVALGQVSELNAGDRKQLAENLAKLPAPVQLTLLETLAYLGEKSVLPTAAKFAQATDAGQRLSGLSALGRLGDAAQVPLICEIYGKSTEANDRATIEKILCQIAGEQATDEAIAAAMKNASGDPQRSLIGVLAKRNSHGVLAALIAETENKDLNTARMAFQAIGTVSAPEDAPKLLEKVVSLLEKRELRGDAENAAGKTLLKNDDHAVRTQQVTAALGEKNTLEARCSMLRLLRDCADKKALETVKGSLQDKEEKIRDAAIRSLTEWSDDSVWATLTEIYGQTEPKTYHVLALRGLVRLVAAENEHPSKTQLERYKQLLAGAANGNDRRLILGALGGVKDPRAVAMAMPLVSDADVHAEAEMAVKKIAENIRRHNPKEADQALAQLKELKKNAPAAK